MTDITRRQFTATMAAGAAIAASAPLRAATRAAPLDAIIIGAGMSGLHAAWLLEQQGARVMVIEGRQRVGGRVHTLFDLPGTPEMGFNSMGEGYGRGIDAAHRSGLDLIEVGARYRLGKPQMLYLNGKPITREEWATAAFNPFPAGYRNVMPWEVVGKAITSANPLKNFTDWQDPASRPLDISLNSFLAQKGFSQDAIRLANDISPNYGVTAHDTSVLMLEFTDGFAKNQYSYGSGSLSVKGGNELLPRGMAKLVKGDIVLGKEVVAIDSRSDMGEVRCADGSSYTAKRIVCTLPFSTLRNVHITPGMPADQMRAIQTLPYQPISNLVLTATSPFWDEDGLAPGMWTDTIIGTVTPQRYGSTPEEITSLLVQARSSLAMRWDRMGHEQATAAIIATFEQLRPAAKGKLKAHKLFSWNMEYFNAGDWAYFSPGQLTDFVPTMGRPNGRIHFAGEHTAKNARGLEGALESAERVALEVLSA